MSGVTSGSNWYFGTTYGTTGVPGNPASRPAPFPVSDLWCAILTNGGSQPRTVLLAEHEDMYVAAWVMHEPMPEADLDAVCH